EKLLIYLFHNYDPVARAVLDNSKPVNVTINFLLLRIHGLDERSQVLTTTGLVIAEWYDERLTWDPQLFGNLSEIIIKADKIWLPELAVMNGSVQMFSHVCRIRILLQYDGKLHWEPGGIFKTTCDIDIAFFPFDAQHCPLVIGAYSYYSNRMNITNASNVVSSHNFRVNGEWQVYDTEANWNITKLDGSLDDWLGYSHVVFTLHLKRRYKFYIMNIVLPCVMLSVLIMIDFCLPPEAGEKIALGISVLLAFTVFLLMIADNIPRTSSAIPLIVTYLMSTMSLGTISICMTVLILNMHHRGLRGYGVPYWLGKICFSYIAKFVFIETPYCDWPYYTTNRYKPQEKRLKISRNNSKNYEVEGFDKKINTSERNNKLMESKFRNRKTCRDLLNEEMKFQSKQPMPLESVSFIKEWRELARVLDRFFFWILFSLMAFSSFLILLFPKYTGNEVNLHDSM
ncbi:hypothetical protein HELRODRAFT_70180, partial [Helobdella robusta]|uniref:Neurotransmitter-gated ion-channel ligand-binding domain-containing protein n=1 Tax=Helobdella robusta TaxID=6412 RepID=T1G032_HELRO